MKITVKAGLEIGMNSDPFVVAEVGSNFLNRDDVMNSISLAKAAGASAVKFQLYTHKSLYGVDGEIKGQLDPAWLPKMKEKADAVGIELMCSAFSPEEYEYVDKFVAIHKVASAELTHVRILETLKRLGKPVILSTGASGAADIGLALKTLGATPTVLMYCVAAYPANEVNLETIDLLRSRFGLPVGFSDHTTDVLEIPRGAIMRHGACVLEKHFTGIDADTPDRPHSLNVVQFRRMVMGIREGVQPVLAPASEEIGMVKKHNRRLLATREIAVGEVLKEDENFGIYRSLKDDAHAFSPWLIDEVNEKIALKKISAGAGIGPGDI